MALQRTVIEYKGNSLRALRQEQHDNDMWGTVQAVWIPEVGEVGLFGSGGEWSAIEYFDHLRYAFQALPW